MEDIDGRGGKERFGLLGTGGGKCLLDVWLVKLQDWATESGSKSCDDEE